MEVSEEETKEKVELKPELEIKDEPVTLHNHTNNTYPYYQYPPVVDPYHPYPPPLPSNGYYPPPPQIPPGPSALDSLLAFQPPDAGDFKMATALSDPNIKPPSPPKVEGNPEQLPAVQETQEIAPEKPEKTKPSKRKVANDDESTKKEDEKKDKEKKKKKSQDDVKILNIRKNIRDVIDENQLDANTLAAQRQESERLARVQEQQKVIREIQKQIHNNRAQQKLSGLLSGSVVAPPSSTESSGTETNASSSSNSILRSNLSSGSSNNTYIVKGVAQEVKFSGSNFVELDQDQDESRTSADSVKEQEVSLCFLLLL